MEALKGMPSTGTALKTYLKGVRLFFAAMRYSPGISRLPRRFVHKNVPYFSQWESRELVGKILGGVTRAEDDPKWRGSGASTPAEYTAWSWSGCGMACLKMVLAHHNDISVPLVTLGTDCARYGGYDMPLENSNGLKYAPFVRYVKDEFNITANAVSVLPLTQIITELSKAGYVIASVSPSIRDVTLKPKSRGGHLILLLGYDLDKQQLYLHNPSGISTETQEYAVVSFKDFERFFNHQGIVVL